MLTLHLSALDLARTVVRPEPVLSTELVAAGRRLVQPGVPRHLETWYARTRAALRPVMRPFLDLMAVPRWAPDFLMSVDVGNQHFDRQVEQVLATPGDVLRAELRPRVDAGELPARTAALAAGDRSALEQLGAAMIAFHQVALAPYWPEITAAVHADRAARGTTLVDQGIDQVLRTLSPHLRWEASSLSYECPGGNDVELEACGRGLVLVPSYLAPVPSFQNSPGGPVRIRYPIDRLPVELTTERPLADLLGRRRAEVLAHVRGGRSTSQIANGLAISLGSASQHTKVLRAAGLISTHRAGSAVRHTLTPLGASLLRAAGTAPM
ncbi:ArsR/SmtB family transcription factor [Kribbella sp. CA-247076]|uniref:ArsR/SmtB family transcription factor n=1 Tax=Kribbella sp. CA-247076 TaxID=3239941 RepID=UPI003D8BF2AE